MRRLPIFFLVDVSESMIGEPLDEVQRGLETLIRELRQDPNSLETAYLSILAFAGKPIRISALTEIFNFYPPRLPIGGGTSLGLALDFLMAEMDSQVKKPSPDSKGDWKPIIFLFSDGVPTDEFQAAVDRWKSRYKDRVTLVAVAIGSEADISLLQELTEYVFVFNDTETEAYKKFFRWVTQSIKATSQSVTAQNIDKIQLTKLDSDILKNAETGGPREEWVDSKWAVIPARCQKTKQPYLMKYLKTVVPNEYTKEFGFKSRVYRLTGAYPVEQSYFDLSGPMSGEGLSINTQELLGFPYCPCCGNQFGFALCQCGKVLCTGNEEMTTCPWCGLQGKYGTSSGSAEVGRGRG